MILALFATQTRGALIVLVFGFVYMLVVGDRAIPRGQLMKVVFVALALFYLSFAFVGDFYEGMLARMTEIGERGDSVESRSEVLVQAIDAIPDSPFLGHGIMTPEGTFRGAVTANIHNLYVTLAYTIGIPGLLFFLWLLSTLWRESWWPMRDRTVPADLRELMLALHVMLVMFIIDQIKIEYTRQELTMHLDWMLFGLIIATRQIAARSRVVR
jgi:O-antigen ligase